MRILGFSILIALTATGSIRAEPAAEQQVLDAVKAPDLTVVHLWAPWCSNCQVELKSGGWLKMAKENPKTRFIFVSVWNNGNDGRPMLEKFGLTNQANVTITADPGPRTGDAKIKQLRRTPAFLDSGDFDLQRGRPSLRLKLRRDPLSCAPAISSRQ